MYVVRLKSIDSILNFKSFASRPLAQQNFEAGQDRVIEKDWTRAPYSRLLRTIQG
jgi:hypothetical protein